MPTATLEPIIASEEDKPSLQKMEEVLTRKIHLSPAIKQSFMQFVDSDDEAFPVPTYILQLLQQIVNSMVHGRSVGVISYDQALDNSKASLIAQDEPISIQPCSESLEALAWIEETTGLSQERIGELLGVTAQTISDWKQASAPISDEQRERLFTVRKILETALENYPTKESLATWLDAPRHPGDPTPAQLFAQNEMNKARLVAFLSPLPPSGFFSLGWADRPIPEKFRPATERWDQPVRPWPDPDEELERWMKENNYSFEDFEDPD